MATGGPAHPAPMEMGVDPGAGSFELAADDDAALADDRVEVSELPAGKALVQDQDAVVIRGQRGATRPSDEAYFANDVSTIRVTWRLAGASCGSHVSSSSRWPEPEAEKG